ncbi:hypothetical protein ABH931_007827 [Streptacidiphilus sp. MAP12-33]|uniref:DUF4439 domain-containing protein n=1 Tax=Streptacidiphilus sp. MAP12-33 TaxID=3156266 RepID=UPI003511B073
MAASLRRRSLLTAGLLASLGTLSACGSDASSSARSGHASASPRPTPVDLDTAARQQVGAAMTTLLAGYDSAAAHTELRRGLATQLAALGAGGHAASPSASAAAPVSPASASASASAPVSASPTAPATASGARARPGDAELASGEAGLVSLCVTQLQVVSPVLARLLASIGAGAAQRTVQLGGRVPAATVPSLARLRPTASELDALQAALGAEQATVFGYGVLGALLSGGRRSQATSDFDLHRARRDTLESLITASGATPQAAAAAYTLPFEVTDTASARRLAALLESRLAAVYANAVQASAHAFRDEAATQLRLTALRAQSWGATSTPFPGLPDH